MRTHQKYDFQIHFIIKLRDHNDKYTTILHLL